VYSVEEDHLQGNAKRNNALLRVWAADMATETDAWVVVIIAFFEAIIL
jgi:hypothetical protein